MLASACPTSFRRLETLLLLVPLSFALAFLLSPTLDSHHLAGPRSLHLSLNRMDIPLVLISLLSTLRPLLVIPPRLFCSPPVHFHPEGHPLSRFKIPLHVCPNVLLQVRCQPTQKGAERLLCVHPRQPALKFLKLLDVSGYLTRLFEGPQRLTGFL